LHPDRAPTDALHQQYDAASQTFNGLNIEPY
jgi:hypothetical protein